MSFKYPILSLLCILSFVIHIYASPFNGHFRRQGTLPLSAMPTPSPNVTREIQTVETTRSFTSADGVTVQSCTIIEAPMTLSNGESAVVITEDCSSTFIPSTHSSPTVVKSSISFRPSSSAFTTSTFNVPSSSFSSSPPPSPSPSTSPSSPFSASVAFLTPVASQSLANSVLNSSGSPRSTSSSSLNTSSSLGDKDNTGGHLSSLPIFLGAFGGVAVLALIIVGCMVYRPFQRLNNMRLHPPACIRRVKNKTFRDSNFSFHCTPEKQAHSPMSEYHS